MQKFSWPFVFKIFCVIKKNSQGVVWQIRLEILDSFVDQYSKANNFQATRCYGTIECICWIYCLLCTRITVPEISLFLKVKEIRLPYSMSIVHDNHNLSLCESFMKFSTSFAEEKFAFVLTLTRSHKASKTSKSRTSHTCSNVAAYSSWKILCWLSKSDF